MATSMANFPLALVSDGLINYIQHVFSSPEHTPSEYRWNKNDRESRITISGPFVINNERPNSAPYIIVERGGFMVDNRVIDNLKKASENTFEEPESVMVTNGAISITIGSQVASEASSIANYIMIQMQADRHGIMNKLGFIRNFNILNVSPEEPVFKDAEVKRWKVAITINVSIQMGWIKHTPGVKLEKLSVVAVKKPSSYESDLGIITSGSDNIIDSNANFGFDVTSNPQMLSREFDNGYYYVQFEDETLYDVVEIVDSHTLKLEKDGKPFNPSSTESCTSYKLLWNDVHLHVEI